MNVAFALIHLALQGVLAAEAPVAPPAEKAEAPAAAPAKAPESPAPAATPAPAGPVVVLQTTMGDITLELDGQKAPISTANFLKYVRSGHYDGTIFHRVISNFMIQGGGMNVSMIQKPTGPSIKNEHSNGLRNDRGTISMARTNAPDSATSQFFINLKSNDFLDRGDGYAVFGKVTEGMDVVDKIGKTPTTTKGGVPDVPVSTVTINKATVKFDPKAAAPAEKPAPEKPEAPVKKK